MAGSETSPGSAQEATGSPGRSGRPPVWPPQPGIRAQAPQRQHRIVLRWLVLAQVVVVGLIAVLLAVTLSASRSAHRQRAFDAVESLSRSLEQNVSSTVQRLDLALRQIAHESVEDRAHLSSTGADRLRQLVPEAERLRIVEPAEADTDLVRAVRAAAAGRLVITGPRQAGPGDRWVLDAGLRLSAEPGARELIVASEIDVAVFERLFASLALGGDSAVAMRTTQLALVARHTDPPTPRTGLGTTHVSAQFRAALQSAPREGVFLAETALDGIERANAYRRVGETPLIVAVGLATTDYLRTWRNEARLAAGLALLAAAVLVAGSTIAYRAWRRADDSRREQDREHQRFLALMRTASDGLHVLDRNGRLLEFSDAFASMLGRTRQELTGAHVTSWELGYSREQIDRVLRSFSIGDRIDFNSVFQGPGGARVEVDVAAVGVRIDGLDQLYLAARDVTERHRSLEALRSSEAFLDRTGRIANVGGWDLDLASGQLRLTRQAALLLDLAHDAQPSLRSLLRLMSATDRRRLAQALAQARIDGLAWDLEVPATTRQGRRLWLRCFGEPVREAGRVERMIGAVQDISELRARSVELRREQGLRMQLQAQARDQDRMLRERGEMLDVLAHEVRQPLNNASAAMQSAAAALRELDQPVVTPRLSRAQNVLGQVMARIDNTLAVAALLARPGPIEREEADIDTLVGVAVADMPAADRPRVQVVRETTARTASMDMSLMRLALRNLLSNALKYSPPGAPVTVRLADSDAPLGLLIDVIDQGPGVEPALRERLFERGGRGSRGTPGTGHGLGLYIVRRVMELHGGHAQLLESSSQGTTMRLLMADAPDE